MKRSLIVLLMVIGCSLVQAQVTGGAASKKAQNYLNEARIAYSNQDIGSTINFLEKALAEEPQYLDALNTLGMIYALHLKDYKSSLDYFNKTIELDSKFDINAYIGAATASFMMNNFATAKDYIAKMYQNFPSPTDAIKVQADRLIANADFAEPAIQHPVPFNPEPVDAFNSQYPEYFPALTADDQYMYFTRRLPTRNPGMVQEDIFESIYDNGNWQPAQRIGEELNTAMLNEGAHTVSPTGKYLIFTGCNRPDGMGSCDLYLSKRVGDKWTTPKNMGPQINTRGWESQPSFSGDGKALFFVSKRADGLGEADIYVSYLDDKTGFTPPKNLGDVINTSGTEERPFIHPDNKTLYFTSEGHPGMGGMDIFYSRWQEDGTWSKPKNLGYPINTNGDETGIFINSKGTVAYIASDRAGGKGGDDIYQFDVPDEIKPLPVTYVKGMVRDAVTAKFLPANIQLFDVETGEKITSLTSDAENGSFLFTLPIGKNYMYNVQKDGYLFYSANFSLKDHPADKPFQLKVNLEPMKSGSKVVLRNIFFETNKYDLLPESTTELDKLVELLNKNIQLKIEIGGHTDNVGDDTSNKTLSNNRANAVMNYLIKHGISASRLSAKGYGEDKPIADNSTEEGRAQNRRTEFTVL